MVVPSQQQSLCCVGVNVGRAAAVARLARGPRPRQRKCRGGVPGSVEEEKQTTFQLWAKAAALGDRHAGSQDLAAGAGERCELINFKKDP